MNINSRPLSLNMLANVDKFAGRLGCLEEMPSGGGFEGDYPGCWGCLERCLRVADSREISLVAGVASKDAFAGGGFEGDYFGRRVASK